MGLVAQLNFAVFIFGLIVGSFLNALIYRLAAGRSIAETHSVCPHCQHQLEWFDLIPVVSFFMLGRKCRHCRKPISWQYPLVELTTGALFVLLVQNFQFSIFNFQTIFNVQFWFQLIFVCFLIVIFVYDLKHYLILDKVVLPAAVLALGYQGFLGNLGNALVGAALLSGFFGLLYAVSRGRWIGFGDVKLGIFLGLLAAWPQTLVLFFLAYILGAMVGLALMAAGKRGLGDKLPFGTFLTLAGFMTMLWGEKLISWYFNLLGLA